MKSGWMCEQHDGFHEIYSQAYRHTIHVTALSQMLDEE